MPFLIIATDKPGSGALRTDMREAHLAYLLNRQDTLLAGGAMLSDEGAALGSLLIIDTEDRAEAEAFAAGDPFAKAGLFEAVQVQPWRKAFFNFERFF